MDLEVTQVGNYQVWIQNQTDLIPKLPFLTILPINQLKK